MNEMLTAAFLAGLLAAAVRMATPLLFAGLGEWLSERSGVVNLGIEGIMALGALVAFLGAYFTGSLWLGTALALAAGIALGLVQAALAVSLGVSQHVAGLGLTIFASGLALYVHRLVLGTPATPPHVTPFAPVHLRALSEIPFAGPILFGQYALTYLALLLLAVLSFLVYRTRWGLSLRAAGENPAAADAAGINVYRARYAAVALGGGLMGLGGAFLSIAQFNMFLPGMVAGRGWVALALVVFGKWKPGGILLGALFFGALDAAQLRLQGAGLKLPYQYLLLLPYLLTIVLLAFSSRGAGGPGALLRPYRRE